MRTIIALDFDCTIIDVDSDHAILELLPRDIHATLCDQYASVMPWPDFMNRVYEELHRTGRTRSDIETIFRALPLPAAMRTALKLAKESGAVDLVVVSDANTATIRECLRANELDTIFSEIVTNEATWTDTRLLEIARYVPADAAHGCRRTVMDAQGVAVASCTVNICKGREINRLRAGYDRVIYLGDGQNDFCPGCELTCHDIFMPRRNYDLHRILSGSDGEHIQANVMYWSNADDVLAAFQSIFAEPEPCTLADAQPVVGSIKAAAS
ncbi:phosphatase phospho-type [Thamnocephalis sphaerospora]|uniref:Phosphatase phospho-type n=1 Tax=Thamnocephalis sphaerospora TaxID=78915 RepID=A0A4P9XKL1_9FUNG|nr:phosphatase phospho-type [Thamnocephalis sphaerospora]|eukprot:RKP05800.1 phosphatase phospho-type [Thamnocephalis sphaerospora]